MKQYFILILFSLNFMTLVAQPLAKHQWKDRILLLFGPTQSSSIVQEQMATLQDLSEDLQDRDLVLYQINPEKVVGPNGKLNTKNIEWFYDTYQVSKTQFSLILIGKDGGEKLRKNVLTQARDIFALIDSMPMRRAEMSRKRKQ